MIYIRSLAFSTSSLSVYKNSNSITFRVLSSDVVCVTEVENEIFHVNTYEGSWTFSDHNVSQVLPSEPGPDLKLNKDIHVSYGAIFVYCALVY